MLRIYMEELTFKEKKFLLKFCKFVLGKFLTNYAQRKAVISIHIISTKELKAEEDKKDFKDCKAIVYDHGIVENKRKFVMNIHRDQINKRGKTDLSKFKNLLLCLAHELVHVKQYLKGELVQYKSGKCKYMGELMLEESDVIDETYWNAKYEIEAYGREHGLYTMFKKSLTKEEGKKD